MMEDALEEQIHREEEEQEEDQDQEILPPQDMKTINGVSDGIDTTDVFHSVFQGKMQFESWEDFITPFEQFQVMTNSVFKPKSSVCVNWINEKRTTEKIHEKFVYSKVNMICQHYGLGVRKANSNRKRESYVGQDCEAYVKLSYKKGFLNITKYNLVHTNHALDSEVQNSMRKIRPVIFDDDIDLLITRVCEDCNVFETRTSELNWQTANVQLGESDPKLEHLTRRMLKKRLGFLMDRYAANSEGGEPLEGDEMGQILHRLMIQKEKVMAPTHKGKRGRKKKHSPAEPPVKRGRGRPKKLVEDDFIEDSGVDYGAFDVDDDYTPISSSPRKGPGRPKNSDRSNMNNSDIATFLNYWTKRDAEERRMRGEELKLRREELELQKNRFELEQKERNTLMETLKTQGQIISSLRRSVSTPAKQAPVTKEFILNKDGTLQPVIQDHGDGNKEPAPQQQPVQLVHSHTMSAHASNISVQQHSTPGHVSVSMPGHSHTGSMPVHGHTATMHVHNAPMVGHHNMQPQQHGAMATSHGLQAHIPHATMGGHLQGHH